MKNQAAVLDVGSQGISVLIGERGVNNTFVIKGYSIVAYDGYQDGEFLNIEGLGSAVAAALTGAKAAARTEIGTLYVGVPGEFTGVIVKEHRISFPRRKKIRAQDEDDLYDSALADAGADRTIVNRSSIYFTLDGNRRVADPIGEASDGLGGLLSYLYVERYFRDTMDAVLAAQGIRDVEYVASSLAEALFLFTPEERDRTAILADVGYISSFVAVVAGDGILHQEAFSFGGGHISALLTEAFEVDFRVAELLKRSVNLGFSPKEGDNYELSLDDRDYSFSVAKTNEIVASGLDAVCEKIQSTIQNAESEGAVFPEYVPVSLTGGGICHIRGAKEYMAKRLNRMVQIVHPDLPRLSKPSQSSELGLLDLALEQRPAKGGFFGKLFG